jgi:hypothetical protein
LLSLPRCKIRILNSSYPFIIGSEVALSRLDEAAAKNRSFVVGIVIGLGFR